MNLPLHVRRGVGLEIRPVAGLLDPPPRARLSPHYVGVKIQPEAGPGAAACLQIDLDGGAAVALSPPVPIDPQCRYMLEVSGKTEGLKHDRAFLSIDFLDENQRPLQTVESSRVADSTPGPVASGPVWPRQRKPASP